VTPLDPDLRAALHRAARVDHLLVASDYDGTLSPIVTDPARAVPLPGAPEAVAALAALPRTTVVVISGRSLRDLAALAGLTGPVQLVGGHGGEFDAGFADRLEPAAVALRARLGRELADLTRDAPGVRLEPKPAGVAVHTRTAPRPVAEAVVARVVAGPATWPGVHVMTGKEVVELSVVKADKGTALDALRAHHGAGVVVFLGDDVTDEHAFARLRGDDVGVKVGPGDTAARHRVDDPAGAVGVLSELTAVRASWLAAHPDPG
jgi:trehalose-phosphatase